MEQVGPRRSKLAAKLPQHSPNIAQDGPDTSQDCPMITQDGPDMAQYIARCLSQAVSSVHLWPSRAFS